MKFNASVYACGVAVLLLGLGFKVFTAAEVLTSAIVSSVIILALGVPPVILYMIWHKAKNSPRWARVPSRNPTLMTCQTADIARPRITE